MSTRRVIIHACMFNGEEVMATKVNPETPPGASFYKDVDINFAIEWKDGTRGRQPFRAIVPRLTHGDNHFDLILGGDGADTPATAKVGLRPWFNGQSDAKEKTYWINNDPGQIRDIPLYHFAGMLAPDHFVVQVQPGMMQMAVGLFIQLGWCELIHKRQSYPDCEIRFVRTTVGNYPDVQLTELKANKPFAVVPTIHLGFKMCPPNSPLWMVNILKAWADEQGISVASEEANHGKWFICFPSIFAMPFELVP